ncbi:hypothetical protein QE370_000455 [Aeromicrobium sp. SORGH_AS981]|uniref:hypothetical protein n=1 Tax=Aeromicrobium sp. SORGH_AS_0981 TaxID=3041802 RepID=UPI0028664E19|nr:hypothetical protein [Aeromicrobium sp. SORGH_AS_0981]MDR6117271.1 hypothetical protein [Aeromicrobium sp. SORGH_AS_0981]
MSDADVLALLRDVPHLNVHDGQVDVDETNKVILVELPYVVFWSTSSRDRVVGFSGGARGRVEQFQLTGVGETREQAKAVLEKARAVLNRRRIAGGLCKRDDDNPSVRRDDIYTRPGGGPVFYGADRYTLPT